MTEKVLEKMRAQAPAGSPRRIFNLGDEKFEDVWTLKDELGRGAFATVYRCTEKATGKDKAVKVVNKNNIDMKAESLKNEVVILRNIQHPNVLSLSAVYEDDTSVYMVMDLMAGGELFDKICNAFPNGYSEKQASAIIHKILLAVAYLHERGIIHRDLKPENLLFADPSDNTTDIKIADFGLAKIWNGDMLIRTACGSPNYVAPEILLHDVHGYTLAIDMWSVGVISYVLLCGFCPFHDERTPILFKLIITGEYCFPSPYWDDISDEAKDFIQCLLVTDPSCRATAQQALQHPFITNNSRTGVISNVTETLSLYKEMAAPNQEQRDELESIVRKQSAKPT